MKKQSDKERKAEFFPGMELDPQFEAVLSLLSEWTKSGIVTVEVDSDGDVSFKLPRELGDLLGTQAPEGLNYEGVAGIIDQEIPVLISAGFVENKESFLRGRLPSPLEKDTLKMLGRSKKAFDLLVDEKIKERVLLKRSAAAYVINSVKALMETYHIKDVNGEAVDLPHVLLEFGFVKPSCGRLLNLNPFEGLMLAWKDAVNVQVVLHKKDIVDLIEKLNKVHEQMSQG